MTAEDLTALNEQIAAMSRSGLPLDQGLESLAREMRWGRLRSVTDALADDLRHGHTLPEALARRKGQVPEYYANLVTAGIQTGRLPEVLTTLTNYARSVSATWTIVLDALFYPVIVLILGAFLFTILSMFILPQFDKIFQDFGLTLPWVTEFVLAFGKHPFTLILLPIAIIIGGLVLGWVLTRFTPRGRRVWARFVYHIPLLGGLIRAARLSSFTDLLGMLVEYGVPLPTAFRLAGSASSDPIMATQAETVEERLRQGTPLADSFRNLGLVPRWVAWIVAQGEKRGSLGVSLREIATVYRRQAESRTAVLRSVLPPVVVIATAGFLTGFFAIAIMLPMIKLLEGLSK